MKTHLSPEILAQRWACHRTTASRIIRSYGRSGWKSHAGRGAIRRYPVEDVEAVERLLKAAKKENNV
jgi:hypothetical protein